CESISSAAHREVGSVVADWQSPRMFGAINLDFPQLSRIEVRTKNQGLTIGRPADPHDTVRLIAQRRDFSIAESHDAERRSSHRDGACKGQAVSFRRECGQFRLLAT